MKLRIKGELSTAELRQTIYEQLHLLEDDFVVRHTKDITVYFTPTNGFGEEVLCRDYRGKEVSTILVEGPYRAAVDEYGF